jgi:hypothetical protein
MNTGIIGLILIAFATLYIVGVSLFNIQTNRMDDVAVGIGILGCFLILYFMFTLHPVANFAGS